MHDAPGEAIEFSRYKIENSQLFGREFSKGDRKGR